MSEVPSASDYDASVQNVMSQIEPKRHDETKNFAPDRSIEELLKDHEDVEIVFWYQGKELDRNTLFLQLKKEDSKPQSSLQLMLSHFNSLSDAKTIYFSVRDRENYQANQRKDSLLDFDGVRQQRTKSEYVESGSFCVNAMVQHMIAHFKI